MEFNSIGFFQFDNLLQNRVPFLLITLDETNLKSWYNSVIQMHIDNISVSCSEETALDAVKEKNLPLHFAIIVLDIDGTKSSKMTKTLERAGYTNVFYIKDGFQGLSRDRQS